MLSTSRLPRARSSVQMVIIDPRVDQRTGLLHIKIPAQRHDELGVTVTTPLDPSPDQLASYELIQDITIWGVQVGA
jgi:hypothetical protein